MGMAGSCSNEMNKIGVLIVDELNKKGEGTSSEKDGIQYVRSCMEAAPALI